MAEMIIYAKHNFIKSILSKLKWIAIGIAYIPSRLIYGNMAGLLNNFFPLRELKKFQNTSNVSLKQILQQQTCYIKAAADLLHKEGAYLIKSNYSEELLKTIHKKYIEMIGNDLYSTPSTNGCSTYLKDPDKNIPELKELISTQFQDILMAYYGCYFTISEISAWRNHHVPAINIATENTKYDVFSNTFHNDGTARTSLRLFVLLSDGVTKNSGAFRYHNKTNSEKIVKSLGFFSRQYMSKVAREKLADPKSIKYFEGNIGDAALCNTQECLHAASIPEKKDSFRDMIMFIIHPKKQPIISKEDMFS
jgi:hypothetical protein